MADALLLIIRWVHAIAAVAWVGGGIFYWLVLRPALRGDDVPPAVGRFAGAEFGGMVVLAMWTLVVTGAVLAFTRLAEPTASVPYGAVLAVKVGLAGWMFLLTVGRRRPASNEDAARGRWRSAVNAVGHVNMTVVLGIVVFLLSDVLRLMVERALKA